MLRQGINTLPLLLSLLTGCFATPFKSDGKFPQADSTLRVVASTSATLTKSVSVYNPSADAPTEIAGPKGALSNSSIVLPPGAIAISVDLVIEESVPLSDTSVAGSLNLRSDLTITPVGSGLIIRPTENVDLTKPLTIAMPLGIELGLSAIVDRALGLAPNKNYAVFYKNYVGGELKSGVIPSSALRFTGNDQVTFEGYFGAYWLVETNFAIEEKVEVPTTEPMMNNDRVLVIESAGVVSESVVQAVALIPEVQWQKLTLSADLETRSVTLSGSTDADDSVKKCLVEICDASSSAILLSKSTDNVLKYSYSIPDKGKIEVKGRFRCQDKSGRLVMSEWSSAALIPAYVEPIPAVAPTFSLASGLYGVAKDVSLASETVGATIYYTTDGSTPTVNSNLYKSAISISASMVLKAIATKAGLPDSSVSSITYTFTDKPVSAVAFSVSAGTYTAAQAVALSTSTEGASIYYTVDGSTPTSSSLVYSSPLAIAASTSLKAIALKTDFKDSVVQTAAYVINLTPVATPTFSIASGTYTSAQSVTVTTATSGATLYYTTDGSTPSSSSTVYVSPIAVAASRVVKAIAVKAGMPDSSISSAAYTINDSAVGAPMFSIAGGSYSSTQTVALSSSTSGASIRYTTDGSTPNSSSTLYSVPLPISTSLTLKAIAMKTDYPDSSVSSASYVISMLTVAAPLFSLAGGTYSSSQTLTLTSTTSGATIFYTTDGSTPTSSSNVFSASLTVSTSQVIKAIATKAGELDSTVSTVAYTINSTSVSAPTFSVGGGTYGSAQTVSLSTATSGATIYYTTTGATPTTSSTLYTGPISVTTSKVLKAFAVKSGFPDSGVASATYVISGTSDSNPPTLAAMTLSSPTIDTSSTTQSVTVSITIADDFALSDSQNNASVSMYAPTGSQSKFAAVYAYDALAGATSTQRSFDILITFPPGSTEGNWSISLNLRDNLGNTVNISSGDLAGFGFPSVLNNTASSSDSTPPTLTAMTLSSATIDTTSATQNVTVSFTVNDDFALSDTQNNASISMYAPTGSQSKFAAVYAYDALAGATSTQRSFSVVLSFPAGSTEGNWTISLNLRDNLGNTVNIGTGALEALTFPSVLNNTASSSDSTPPTLTAMTLSSSSIDTSSSAQNITVSITVNDDFALSDVQNNASISMYAPTGSQSKFAAVYAYDALAGATSTQRSFDIVLSFPQGSTGGNWTISLNLRDNLGNTVNISSAALGALTFPSILVNNSP